MRQVFKILFCHETLHVSGIYCAHHQELSAVHLAIGMFHAGYVAGVPTRLCYVYHVCLSRTFIMYVYQDARSENVQFKVFLAPYFQKHFCPLLTGIQPPLHNPKQNKN